MVTLKDIINMIEEDLELLLKDPRGIISFYTNGQVDRNSVTPEQIEEIISRMVTKLNTAKYLNTIAHPELQKDFNYSSLF